MSRLDEDELDARQGMRVANEKLSTVCCSDTQGVTQWKTLDSEATAYVGAES